jgi:hypothetical protein
MPAGENTVKPAEYILETHVHHQPVRKQTFIGTRSDACQHCRDMDRDKLGQTTHIAFVRYVPEVEDTERVEE